MSPMTITSEAAHSRRIWIMFLSLVAINVFAAYGFSKSVRDDIRESQIAGCERSKQDRLVIAKSQAAMITYYEGVLAAKSVQEDVKRSATVIHDRLTESRNSLRSRILECEPLIDEGERIPDADLLAAIG
jgi:hypothetical protein